MSDRSMLHNIISKDEMVHADRQLARQMTVLRYKMARAMCFGRVVDAACDAGYGTWFLSLNPDVTFVTGLDCDDEALSKARQGYSSESKVGFAHGDLNSAHPFSTITGDVDVLVTLETLEHLVDPIAFLGKAVARGFSRIVTTFPSFKTTHFNPHHLHDLKAENIDVAMMSIGWRIAAYHNLYNLCDFIVLERS